MTTVVTTAETAMADPELEHLEAIYRSALALCGSTDPLLRGQYQGLLGRVTVLLTIKTGRLPPVLEDTAGRPPA